MLKSIFKTSLFVWTIFTLIPCSAIAQQNGNPVIVVGEMKNVMRKGQLHGNIYLDTISRKDNLYGLGPVEDLAGEILIIGGRSYKSSVLSDTEMHVEETYDIKAPFFGYANISDWKELTLPDSIQSLEQLEIYLDKTTKLSARPFMFKLSGIVEYASIHIVNLPKGTKVNSPEEAHKGLVSYTINNEASDIIGFFSTDHKTIFTHHDTWLHMHLITADRQKMGHLDEGKFSKSSMKLYLPVE
ncbi:MAG TPA: acetolactate decarboxylase [Saprospiraceae bacterium]|nr:acetolactate decarboxylase [Saprospiraceae bacterium]